MSDADVETPSTAYARVDTLISEERIQARVRELGRELSRDYAGQRPLLIAVLKGGSVFLSDLIRRMDIDLEIDFLSLSSYGNATTSSGKVHLVHDLRADVAGRHVVLVEGVVDTGHLDKVPCRRVPVPVDYVGFPIGDEFVIGYGMDAAESLRQLPYVGVAVPHARPPERDK